VTRKEREKTQKGGKKGKCNQGPGAEAIRYGGAVYAACGGFTRASWGLAGRKKGPEGENLEAEGEDMNANLLRE